jgi:hypothetical protein
VRHLAPPPNPQQDPGAELLQQVKGHEPAQVIGHVALEGSDAASEWMSGVGLSIGCCGV